ncbi:Multidrug resistance protein MexB [BD1-7 clade bacterium]|uniref:Multidrug resistance protein MexB n=1 Tax=BD1-7 clade bacterium TaxID=2029982 RepID=A0A5S9MZ15_9GAMM|nr:Multidrug resistance protein MexB [BD1-7 clade bacterium]CAA0082678.1 Multidrug resistance protein MexB [BD1-7 clade bacterium]
MVPQEKGVIAWFVDNPVAANLLMAFILIMGWLSVDNIRKELIPAKSSDIVTITVDYPSASPLEVEEGITLKIEDVLKNVQGIKKVNAVSNHGNARVQVEVDDGFDIDRVVDDIKIGLDAMPRLPEHTEKLKVKRALFSGLAIQVQISGNISEADAKTLAAEMRAELLAETDAKKISVWGDRPFEIAIEADPAQLEKYNLTINDLSRKIRAESVNLPSGGINSAKGFIILRVEGQSYRQQDFENIVILTTEEGSVIRLGDIANVRDGFVEWGAKGYFDGRYSVGLAVFSVGDQDISDVARQVQQFVKDKQKALPEGVYLTDWADVTYYLDISLTMMLENMLWGALLVFLILALFLDLKTTFWVIAGLPVCFLGTFILMPTAWVDVSLNLVSIFGFILVLGIIVDDAIIVAESIDGEIRQQGFSQDAVVKGAKRVALPVTFGVLTTVVAFTPMVLVDGPWQAAPHAIGFIVILCLLFSLVESKLILPAHLASMQQGIFRAVKFRWHDNFQKRNNEKLMAWVKRFYVPVLRVSTRHRYTTVAGFIGLLLLTLGLIFGGVAKYVLLPAEPSDFLKVNLTMGEGTPEETTQQYRDHIYNSLVDVEKNYMEEFGTDIGFIRHVFSFNKGETDGLFTLELNKPSERKIDSFEIIERWRDKVGEIPQANMLEFLAATDGGSRKMNFMLASRNNEQLSAAAEELYNEMKNYQGLRNFSNSAQGSRDSFIMHLKPKAKSMGLTLADISRQVRQAFYGDEAQRIQREEHEIRVMVKYPKDNRRSIADLEEMMVRLPGERFISLSELVYLQPKKVESNLTRVNYESAAYVGALADRAVESPGKISSELKKTFIPALLKKYPEVQYRPGGAGLEQDTLEQDLKAFFGIACMLVFILLAIPLKSYFQPLIIMSVIPFGVIGAVIGHIVMGYPISMMSLFGIIALTGVVVNDSLVMVDFINQARRSGQNTMDAAIEAGTLRFRAIFLTTATTFVGVIPMLLENAQRAETMVPMAISLGFGIVFATGITLLLVPCLYLIVDDGHRLAKSIAAKAEG